MSERVASLTAGILTAEGRFTDDVTVADAVEVLSTLRARRSIWLPGPFADDADADARLALPPPERLASWSPPDAARLERLEHVLVDAWEQADLGAGGNVWAQPALRLVVPGLDDQRALTGADARGLLVATHTEMTAGRFAWRWPLRISVPRADGLEVIAGGHFFRRLYAINETPPGDEVDVVVVRPADIGRLDDVLATVAVVVDAEGWDPSELLDSARRRGLAAVLLVPDITPGLLDLLIEEMSHDQPLDVAAAIHLRGATLVASGDLLAFTSVRAWSDFVGSQLPAPEGEELRTTARHRPFDHESEGTSHSAEVAGQADPQLVASITSVRLAQAAMGEALVEPQPPAPPPQPPSVGPRPVAPPAAEPPLSAAQPGERRLQAKLTDGKGKVRTDGFVAGQRHELRIRIAAEQSAEVLPANVRFDPPVPGEPVDLTIVVRVRGSKDPPARRKLRLPADADSAWTNPVPIDVPRRATSVAVEIVVLHDGRALQTATLGTRVVRRLRAAAGPFALLVDADTPPSGFEDRATSAVTLLLSAPLGEAPELLDLSKVPQPLSLAGLEKANKAVRKILLDSFLDPPADLAGAAPPLTKLAVRGATLRNQLRGNEASFYDDEPWIHVVCFGQTDLPLELIYTHPMPDNDDSVPVCPTALAGAKECAADCPDRNRSDCVCPFGFWGTSKVVERRVHIEGRTGTTPPQQRRISVTAGAVVGTSTKADEEDKGASKRIVAAVKRSVAAPGFAHIVSWDELATAVAAVERQVLVLITHTVKPADPELDLGVSFELGGTLKAAHRVDQTFVNPNSREPGPVVVSLGCDTDDLDVGYADWVGTLHAARAEIVISTISPVPGREVANFVERMFRALPQQLAEAGPHRCGALLTAVRRATIATGDVLALAITASGDGDVELTAESIGEDEHVLTVEMLPAKCGDALLVTWGTGSKRHHLLIDAGLGSAYPAVAARLKALDGDLELLVVSHVDADHIAGAVRLLGNAALAKRFKGVWFNGFQHLEQFNDILGPLDGERLSALIVERCVPWNAGWPDPVSASIGGAVVVRDAPPVVKLAGGAKLTVLSPTPQKLKAMLKVWTKVIRAAGLVPGVRARPDPVAAGRGLLGASLDDLAGATVADDDAEANGSSIAFVFEFGGKRVLFGADAHPDALLDGLDRLTGPGERYRVDACKLPHHGSRRNVTKALVQKLDCCDWWFSSNGVRFNHPNDEAVARVIRFGSANPRLAGNYRSSRWEAFTADFPPAAFGYELTLPEPGTEGVTITLA